MSPCINLTIDFRSIQIQIFTKDAFYKMFKIIKLLQYAINKKKYVTKLKKIDNIIEIKNFHKVVNYNHKA